MSEKKGFVLYFDSYDSILSLSNEQRGVLLLALYRYADVTSRREVDPQEILEQFPKLTPESCMAFRFLARNIQRDTKKWRERKEHYEQGARKRKEKSKVDDFLDYV